MHLGVVLTQENLISLDSSTLEGLRLLDSAQACYNSREYLKCIDIVLRVNSKCEKEFEQSTLLCCWASMLLSKANTAIQDSLKVISDPLQHFQKLHSVCGDQFGFYDKLFIHFSLAELHLSKNNLVIARREMAKCLNLITEHIDSAAINGTKNEILKILNSITRVGRKARDGFDDYEGSIGAYEKALLLYQQHKLDVPRTFIRIMTELGYSYFLLRKYDKAMNYYSQAWDRLHSKDSSDRGFKEYLYSLTGKVYLHQRNFELAYRYFNEGMQITKETGLAHNENYPLHCNNFGFYYDSLKEYEKAILFFKEALKFYNAKQAMTSVGSQFLYLGRVYNKLGDFAEAVNAFEIDKDILIQFHGANYYKLLYSYEGLGDTYSSWSAVLQNDSMFYLGLDYYKTALALIRRLILESEDPSLKKKALVNAHTIGKKCLLLFRRKFDFQDSVVSKNEDIWEVTEFMHNTLLLQNLIESNELHLSNIPDSLLTKIKDLRIEINELQFQLEENIRGKVFFETSILRMKNLMLTKKDSLRILKEFISDKYPEYEIHKRSLETCKIEEIQSVLEPEQTLIHYTCADSVIFIHIIKRKFNKLIALTNHESIDELVHRYNRSIYSHHLGLNTGKEDYQTFIKQYIETATQLYKILLQPLSAYLSDELIIVPDQKFGNISFEALLMGLPSNPLNFSTYPFLVKKHAILYNFSASVMKEMYDIKHNLSGNKRLLAIAPFYNANSSRLKTSLSNPDAVRYGITELPNSGPELMSIQKHFNGVSKVLFGSDATRANFLRWSPDYQIIHLATHGKANFEEGSLSFVAFRSGVENKTFELVTGMDFQSLRLNAELVVLSACETAVGELNTGNGIISLTSCIASCGAKSIVASLWKVNDKSTMQLLSHFYKELELGKSKSKALQMAKTNYINSVSPSYKHPFYWSGFNLFGDNTVLTK